MESLELHPPLVLESRVLSGLCVLGRLLGTNVIATSVRRTHVAAMEPKQKKHKNQKKQQQEEQELLVLGFRASPSCCFGIRGS
jgi:cytochrome c-type biogenesis protein CcmH/NrfF